MPSYKDLLKFIRQGLSAEEIMARLDVSPARLRQMLANKKLAEQLAIQERLAREVVRHQTAAGVEAAARKLREIAFDGQSETARKACVTLLSEGLAGSNETPSTDADPIDLMTPAALPDASDDEGQAEADQGRGRSGN